MKIKHSKEIAFTVILIACIILNIIESQSLLGVILGVTNAIGIYVYILLLNKPVLAVGALCISNLLSIIYTIITSESSLQITNIIRLEDLLIILALLIHLNIADKKLSETNNEKSILKRLKKDFIFERKPFKIPWWAKLIVYSTLVTVIMTVANSEIVEFLNKEAGFRLYGAIAVTLPLIELLAISTTSDIAYEIFGFKIIMEIYTLYMLYSINSLNIASIILIILEIIVFIYCFIKKVNKIENNKEK